MGMFHEITGYCSPLMREKIDRHKNNIESYVCRHPNQFGGFFVS
jgi:hypothetical protein